MKISSIIAGVMLMAPALLSSQEGVSPKAISARVATTPITALFSSEAYTPPDPAINDAVIVTIGLPGRTSYTNADFQVVWRETDADHTSTARGYRAGRDWFLTGAEVQTFDAPITAQGTVMSWNFTTGPNGGDIEFLFVVPKAVADISVTFRQGEVTGNPISIGR